jgi:hypothetical protein
MRMNDQLPAEVSAYWDIELELLGMSKKILLPWLEA